MTHRRALETLDRTLRDLLSINNPDLRNISFGGKVVVLVVIHDKYYLS